MGAETANTTATVLRGTTQNWAGDTVDSDTPVITGLPVTLAETGKTVQDPTSSTPRTIRQVYCSVPQYAAITLSDRIMDEATGDVYIVIGVTRPPTIIGAPVDQVCNLKRISASTT
jgi:hypothetical protein